MNHPGAPSTPQGSPLGKTSAYKTEYDPTLLYPIERAPKRAEIGIPGTPSFLGADLWTAWELGWLNPRGKPQVAIAHVTIPCETPRIVESKSFKLYLNSFNNTALSGVDELRARISRDVGRAVWGRDDATVGVRVLQPDSWDGEQIARADGLSLDRLDIDCTRYQPAPDLLHAARDEQPVTEVLYSDLLKSNCLVTGQPDWGSLRIAYTGPQIDQAGLLRYIVSFRDHNEFHEQCVERIYMDIWARCRPVKLSVLARYTRRGGLDINPFRASHPQAVPANLRWARQ